MNNLIDYFTEELKEYEGQGITDKKINKLLEGKIGLRIKHAMLKKNFKMREGDLLMVYNGKCYESMDVDFFTNLLQRTLEKLSLGVVYIAGSLDSIKKTCYTGIRHDAFNLNKDYICFNNVVLDVKTGDVLDHSPDLITDFIMPYDYDPKAECPKFLDFLAYSIPIGSIRRVLQEFTGAFLVNRREIKIERMCYLYGTGLNGKGVFMDSIGYALGGDKNCSYITPKDLTVNPRKEYYVAEMDGKIANFDTDGSKEGYCGGEFKKIISGDITQARIPCGKPYGAKHIPLIMAAVNEPPSTTDHTAGHDRRQLWIPFTTTIKKEDIDQRLTQKLEAEAPGIFNWIMQGKLWIEAQDGRFSEAEEITQLALAIKTEGHTILMFLEDQGWVSQSSKVPVTKNVSDLYIEYVKYCDENRNKGIFTKQKFGRFLKQEGYQQKATSRGSAYLMFEKENPEGASVPVLDIDDDVPF